MKNETYFVNNCCNVILTVFTTKKLNLFVYFKKKLPKNLKNNSISK